MSTLIAALSLAPALVAPALALVCMAATRHHATPLVTDPYRPVVNGLQNR